MCYHQQPPVSGHLMPKPILKCERCDYEWASDATGERVTCSGCGYKTTRNVVGEEVFLRGKMLYLECEDIDDMVEATRARLEQLEELRDQGFEVSEPDALKDDYCYLQRRFEEENAK